MLQKRFGEGIIKLYIEEPSQPVMKVSKYAKNDNNNVSVLIYCTIL